MILNDLAKNNKVYIACGYTDMRKSIDGLSSLVQQNFQLDPFQPYFAVTFSRPCFCSAVRRQTE